MGGIRPQACETQVNIMWAAHERHVGCAGSESGSEHCAGPEPQHTAQKDKASSALGGGHWGRRDASSGRIQPHIHTLDHDLTTHRYMHVYVYVHLYKYLDSVAANYNIRCVLCHIATSHNVVYTLRDDAAHDIALYYFFLPSKLLVADPNRRQIPQEQQRGAPQGGIGGDREPYVVLHYVALHRTTHVTYTPHAGLDFTVR